MSNDAFKEYMKSCEYGYDRFFKTYYQLACQLGLYYIDAENNYHPRFFNDINEEQANLYLINWFSKYYVPNPYTRGFELLKNPILVEDTLYEYIKKYGNSKQILEICQEIFKEEIGNPDIFINAINSYSRKIKISNNKFEIKDFKEGSMETGNKRDDKKAFFDTFSKDNGTDKLPFPHNRIIFGAPGTGKSHSLELDRKKNFADDCFERVTFHPNYSYAQFVGTYKPTMIVKETDSSLTDEQKQILSILKDKNRSGQEKYDLLYDKFRDDSDLTRLPLLIGIYSDDEFRTKKADGSYTANDNGVERNHGRAVRPYINLNLDCVKEEITYEYIPGPFMRIYIAAKKNTSQNFLLLIEEINRANVAAVFGDVFQLLDRKSDGTSEYPIATSEDLRKFLAKSENLGGNPDDYKTLSIPANMYIWATMNSADQGVFPMDTAFKRRWEFEYIDINKNAKKLVYKNNKPILIPIPSKEGKFISEEIKYDLYKWNDVREKINEKLSEISSVSEDKLLGSFFINLEKLRSAKKEPQEFIELFKSKVLMYLFEDVVKISPAKLFEKCGDHPRYSTICSKFDEIGCGIFGFELESLNPSETEPSETANE